MKIALELGNALADLTEIQEGADSVLMEVYPVIGNEKTWDVRGLPPAFRMTFSVLTPDERPILIPCIKLYEFRCLFYFSVLDNGRSLVQLDVRPDSVAVGHEGLADSVITHFVEGVMTYLSAKS